MIVPDTIEPYIGYKALNIAPDGTLRSPSYPVEWPVGQRYEASCDVNVCCWTPVPVPIVGDVEPGPVEEELAVLIEDGMAFPPPPYGYPPIELPNGWAWAELSYQHLVADEWCSCGVHVAAEKEGTLGYLHKNGVIVEVALWGQVTVGTMGARGQYAYPQKMWVPDHLKKTAYLIAERYGIEAFPLDIPTRHSAPARTEAEENSQAASIFFSLAAAAVSFVNLTHLIAGRQGPGWLGPALTITAVLLAALSVWATIEVIRYRRKRVNV